VNAGPTIHRNLVEGLRIGVQEGEEQYQFFGIQAVGLDGHDQVYVADRGSSTIRVFTEGGESVRSIGAKGQGPGEFDPLFMAWVGTDEVYAMGRSGGPPALSRFTTAGTYLGSRPYMTRDRTTFDPLGQAGSSWLVRVRRYPSAASFVPGELYVDSTEVARLTADAAAPGPPLVTFATAAMIVMRGGQLMSGPLFEPAPSIAVDGQGRIYHAGGDVYAVDVYSAEGTLQRRISRHHEPRPVDPAWLEAFEGAVREFYRGRPDRPGKDQEIRRVLEGKVGLQRTAHLPPTSRLRVAANGAFWVERSDLDDEPWRREFRQLYGRGQRELPAVQWDVFDASGRYTASVTMPLRFEPMQATEKAVYGVLRDDLDVEYVVRYDIQTQPS
jgi:hypothetical protein